MFNSNERKTFLCTMVDGIYHMFDNHQVCNFFIIFLMEIIFVILHDVLSNFDIFCIIFRENRNVVKRIFFKIFATKYFFVNRREVYNIAVL